MSFLKDREQNIGKSNFVARSLAAFGLFLTGCFPSVSPPVEVSKKLERGYVSIEKISDHSYYVWPVGKWAHEKEYSRTEGIREIGRVCTIERILEYQEWRGFYNIVVVSEANCVPELK